MSVNRPQNREGRRRDRAAAGRANHPSPVRAPGGSRFNVPLIAAVLGGLAIIGLLAWVVIDRQTSEPPQDDASTALPGVYYADLGRGHLQAGQPYTLYNSNPPTSGPHDPVPTSWGVHDTPVPKEKLVHNMEHGGVLILYNCTSACDDIVTALADYTKAELAKGKNIVMAPYPGIDNRIALVSWTRLDAFDAMDVERVKRFIDVHERRFNPEGI